MFVIPDDKYVKFDIYYLLYNIFCYFMLSLQP